MLGRVMDTLGVPEEESCLRARGRLQLASEAIGFGGSGVIVPWQQGCLKEMTGPVNTSLHRSQRHLQRTGNLRVRVSIHESHPGGPGTLAATHPEVVEWPFFLLKRGQGVIKSLLGKLGSS